MNDSVKKDILSLLDAVTAILQSEEEKDLLELGELSDHIIHSASIFQDEESVSIALLIYSIYKVMSRGVGKEKIYSQINSMMKQARSALQNNEFEVFRKKVNNMFDILLKIDRKVSIYFQELLEKAKLNKGSKIYAHGISIARVAQIMGISQWELMSYVGQTEVPEYGVKDVRARLGFARKLFAK
jgi:hypothetical protein